jgi:hypothetical protein
VKLEGKCQNSAKGGVNTTREIKSDYHRGYQIKTDTGQKYVDGEIEKQQNVIT